LARGEAVGIMLVGTVAWMPQSASIASASSRPALRCRKPACLTFWPSSPCSSLPALAVLPSFASDLRSPSPSAFSDTAGGGVTMEEVDGCGRCCDCWPEGRLKKAGVDTGTDDGLRELNAPHLGQTYWISSNSCGVANPLCAKHRVQISAYFCMAALTPPAPPSVGSGPNIQSANLSRTVRCGGP